MKLELIQTNSSAINSIYIIHDFLDDLNYFSKLTDRVSSMTQKDSLNRSSNVKANMSDWKALLKDDFFRPFHKKVLDLFYLIYSLRTPHFNMPISLNIFDSWCMRHKKGDFTKEHTHLSFFSGAFYLKVPCQTSMWLQDYQELVDLRENMLMFFPGQTKHSVPVPHYSEEDRLSIAFNIDVNQMI